MADLEYESKFREMQKYLPFLERVIEKLRNNDQDKPRKAQLEKMQMLHNLLTNKQKKLKVDTLLKCESVLKKLHAKIEKTDELSPPKTTTNNPSKPTTEPNRTSEDEGVKVQPTPSKPVTIHATSTTASKFVPKSNNLIEINTCPASPTQFGDEDFRPPVEIPTERRCSPPVRFPMKAHWKPETTKVPSLAALTPLGVPVPLPVQPPPPGVKHPSSRFQNRSSDYFQNNNKHHEQRQPSPVDRGKGRRSRWSGAMETTSDASSSNAYHKSWSSSSSSTQSGSHRSDSQQRNKAKQTYSSEEENWDDFEDIQPPLPPSKPTKPPPPPSQVATTTSLSSSHYHKRESSNGHQYRHHEKGNIHGHSRDLPSPSPDASLENDIHQKKLFHDTIFKYKKPESPTVIGHPFMNPPPPVAARSASPSVFNRLGDKVDHGFENFRIEVKNDKRKQKPPKSVPPAPPKVIPPPLPQIPLFPIKPIDEVLKSPPLSADDIDDLLNESLDAATKKQPAPIPKEHPEGRSVNALEIVRKKLAMISKVLPPEIDSPPQAYEDQHDKEPFYRRGHTPTKKPAETAICHPRQKSPQRELFKPITSLAKNYADLSPRSPPNPIDNVIERLALKYNPHRRRDSISGAPSDLIKKDTPEIQSPPIKDQIIDPMTDRLALKYNPRPRRDSFVSPLRTDPRVGKMLGPTSPLVTSPISVSPGANVLPTINSHDPRLRNSRVDLHNPGPFCTPIPYPLQIPSLMDINISSCPPPKPSFGIPVPARVDPRTQKPVQTIYADKFNPERNDQTERMKYLESKKKKPPEPKTYGEYKQSKSRQQSAAEVAKVPAVEEPIPATLSTTPSTLDKMYRSSDYGKELSGTINSFKIPKKPKAEEPKSEPKKKEEEPKPEDPAKKVEEPERKLDVLAIKPEEPIKKKQEELAIKLEEPLKKSAEPVKTLDEPKQVSQESKLSPKKSKDFDKPIESSSNSEPLDESVAEDVLTIDESAVAVEEFSPSEPVLSPPRRRGRPARANKKQTAVPLEQIAKEDIEKVIKPMRIAVRRQTVVIEPIKLETDSHSESPSPINSRCRSASDMFRPSTDNSIVSTQNIISGKRKTRASINFSEKTRRSLTPKATPKTSPSASPETTPKVRGKPGPKPGWKTRKLGGEKLTSDDGQICAVSSTTSQGGDAEELHNEESLTAEEIGLTEEPSSSGSKPQTPSVDAEENEMKQEFLEGFLKSIVDPSTNKDRILDMLKAVLDDKKLQQVKEILYSPEDEGRDTPSSRKQQEQNKPRATRAKKNELDRLNEDIRDMFICQGVVTATGRRMCTIAKASSKLKIEKPKDHSKERKAKLKGDSSSSCTPSPIPLIKNRMRRAKVIISPLNIRALRSKSRKKSSEGRPPEMPVLYPNTPIKLAEEDRDADEEDVEEEPTQKKVSKDVKEEVNRTHKKKAGPKSGPRSKRPPTLELDMDSDEDNDSIHPKKRVKGECKEEEVKEQEKENEAVDDAEKTEEAQETIKDDEVATNADEKVDSKQTDILPKNTNPEWHTMSSYATCCVICKEKSRYISPHYLSSHNNAEVYTSRLPPDVFEKIRSDIGNRALYSMPKKHNLTAFHYRCPFCEFQSTSTLRGWMEHFTIHTGEYQYKCSGCFKAMNGCTHLMDHIKKSCPDAKKINREPVHLRGTSITGFVCHLCNFTQMLRSGVVRHLKTQHELDDAESIGRIVEVKLIESAGVPKMKEGETLVNKIEESLAPLPPPSSANEPKASNETNMDVFLSRELASPTSDVLKARLKSINQDDDIVSDSSGTAVSPFKDGQAPTDRMTIAEKLSQKFKNMVKTNLLDAEPAVEDAKIKEPPNTQMEEGLGESQKNDGKSDPIPMEIEETPPVVAPSEVATVNLPVTSPTVVCPSVDSSFNESGQLVIDEQEGDKSPVEDGGSESEWADDNDEDDNENWEDIEITETKGTSHKDKSKNKSIFQTLSRLYASIAPKKGSKKTKEKEKTKPDTLLPSEKPVEDTEQSPLPPSVPASTVSAPIPPPVPALTVSASAPSEPSPTEVALLHPAEVALLPPAEEAQLQPGEVPLLPPQISNLSDLLPDSPSDSLDMLLATNFNCLEGDGTSFPHLDLNDLDSPIFLLSEEQSNLQDAIAMATDLDPIKYDVLGNPLPTQPLSRGSPAAGVQQIGNFGFSLNGECFKYYCMVTACTFLFSEHPDGLQNHFLAEHPTLKWNGYCITCNVQVCPEGGREMQHMLDAHSKTKAEEQAADKPRIKFRRLSGDILSTGKKQPTPPPALLSTSFEPLPVQTPELCLSSMLQSEPKAMSQPTPPPAYVSDIPLYKNVSKEFAITGVVEGVTDDDLRNLVLNMAESPPGGMQISQVRSLNISPAPQSAEIIPSFEYRNSPMIELQAALPFTDSRPPSNPSNSSSNDSIVAISQGPATDTTPRNSPVPTNPSAVLFKCGATDCEFSTSIRSAMNEHYVHHMRTGNDRGSLKCHLCAFMGRSITEYFQHMARGHSSSASTSPSPQANELTQKIQDILRGTTRCGKSTDENLPHKDNFKDRLKKVIEETIAGTGLPESALWKCPFSPKCPAALSEMDFQIHVSKHLASSHHFRPPGTPFNCPHCTANYQRAAVLKAHIKTHRRHQYFCYVCCATYASFQQSQKHFNEAHSRTPYVNSQALTTDEEYPFFVFSAMKLTNQEVTQFGEKLVLDWERKKALNKTHFQPHEQYLLPLQPIFNNQVFCSVCNYKTKVRTNMYRHLQLHQQEVDVASVDPVNPVPCLEKNEKHFDKMLNLACSSNATGSSSKPKETTGSVKIPVFVPDSRRFVCGHPGCTYLTITDLMLRSHLNALHGSEKGYQCPHCQEDICKKTMCAERVVQHLKFHGPKIYQCGECEYLHYTKYVVERHVHDKHTAMAHVNLVSYDRTEGEVNKTTQIMVAKGSTSAASTPIDVESVDVPPTSLASPATKCKWECALCKHQTVTWNQMISHANSTHRAKHQYQCVHCIFGSAHLSHIMDHIDSKHPTKTREAKYVFYKINETPQDKAADTRPLWLRDDPKRVRSIRGILMENEEDAERTKQSLSNAGMFLDDDDDDIEITQVTEPESAMKPGVFGCFHCEFQNEEMSSLVHHWKMKHWYLKNNQLVPKLPFFFRIHSILKCPMCLFIGDYVQMQLHAYNKHKQRTFCASDPKLPNTCGHCPFVYPPKRMDILHKHYQREHKPADVKNLSTSLLNMVLAIGECQVYMQCYFCAEICADKTAIIEHERSRHGSSNFRYKQIKDEVIYRCGMCQYSSTNELATLRHMIDHYGGFKHCHFCLQDETSFNSYMQHCYAHHADELKQFKDIYPLSDMTAFLGQMLLIFPNGLIVNKRNLVHTQYGSNKRINTMYQEICKKALEPPIPPLCMARLMAKKSIEAKDMGPPAQPLLPPPPMPVTAKRIAKRRSTVAMGIGDRGFNNFLVPSGPQKMRKRKASISEANLPEPPVPLFSTITTAMSSMEEATMMDLECTANTDDVPEGVSFYGKQPVPVDLSKIYTQIAIGDKFAPVSVKKFALLFKINAKVIVDKMDFGKHRPKQRSGVICKPCPASKKKLKRHFNLSGI